MCSRDQGGRWSGRGAFRFCAGLIILGGAYPAASSCVPPHCEPPITNYILSCHASIANTPQPVDTSPVCVGSAMEFNIPVLTADLGGYLIRRYKVRRKAHCREPGNVVDCQEAVLPQPIVYTWSIWQGTNQRGNGSGPVAVYYPASPGSYTCRFVTHVTRAICPPNPRSWTTTVTRAAYEVQVTGAVTRLCVGQTIGLSALHARGPVTWASSAPAVATVAAGQVTGLAPGAAVISATDSNGCSDSISVTLLKVDITGPEKTIIYCGAVANNPTITLTADGQPVGGTYMWEIESGPAEIVTSSGNSAQIRGTAIGDAVVKATYGFSGGSCEATHQIKVVKPTSLALVPPPNTTSFTTPFVGYFTDFTYQVLDNDGDPLVEVGDADLTWDETKSSACTTDPPDISLGTGGDVNALGQFLDRHSPGGPFDDVPSDFRAKRTQTFTISGCDVGVRCIFLYNDHADSQAGQCDGNCNF
jgi:hypothetical protein